MSFNMCIKFFNKYYKIREMVPGKGTNEINVYFILNKDFTFYRFVKTFKQLFVHTLWC